MHALRPPPAAQMCSLEYGVDLALAAGARPAVVDALEALVGAEVEGDMSAHALRDALKVVRRVTPMPDSFDDINVHQQSGAKGALLRHHARPLSLILTSAAPQPTA
jgi:hypothetical protein